MGFLRWKALFLMWLFLAFAACGEKENPPSIFEEPSEPVETVTIFSDAPGPQVAETRPQKNQEEEVEPPPQAPRLRANKRYPPPVPKEPPPAPRGPPIPPLYHLEPPPSKVKAFPDFKVESLGIWECDNYTAQYLQCINLRVPRNEDTKLAKALAERVSGWKAKAATESGRSEVIQECQAAMLRTKKAMQPYLCLWR